MESKIKAIIIILLAAIVLMFFAVGILKNLNQSKTLSKETEIGEKVVPESSGTSVPINISEIEQKIQKLELENDELEGEIRSYKLHINASVVVFSADMIEQARKVGIEARKSVVLLTGGETDEGIIASGSGTAWFVAPGLLITNGHNVEESGIRKFKAVTIDGDEFTAEAINWTLDDGDIAVLRTSYTKTLPLKIGSSKDLMANDPLVQVGHPSAIGRWVISVGRVVEIVGDNKSILSTVLTSGGSSGSPILTLDGRVVGMTSGGTSGGIKKTITDEVYQSFDVITFTTSDSIEKILRKLDEWT